MAKNQKLELDLGLLSIFPFLEKTVINNPPNDLKDGFADALLELVKIEGYFDREFTFHKTLLDAVNAEIGEDLNVEKLLFPKGNVMYENEHFTVKLSQIIAAVIASGFVTSDEEVENPETESETNPG